MWARTRMSCSQRGFRQLTARKDQLLHTLARGDELWLRLDVARLRAGGELATKVQNERCDHSARAWRHHEKLAREQHGLVDPMRDEEDAFPSARPDVEAQLLHLLAGQRVKRPQR